MSFQALFTTLFGWYASWIFVSTGHLTAAVAVHSFCNWMGFPDIGRLMFHRFRLLLLASTLCGVVAFALGARHVLRPARFGGGVLDVLKDVGWTPHVGPQ